MPKRQLKHQARHVDMPGVGLPAQMRISVTKVCSFRLDGASFVDNGQGVFFFLFTDLSNPASVHLCYRVAGTGATTPTSLAPVSSQWQNNDFLRFCNPTCYRRFAVYAVTQKQLAMPLGDQDGPMYVALGFDPVRTGDSLWSDPGTNVALLPFQLAGTDVQIAENIFNMSCMNPHYSGKSYNNVAGASPHHSQTIDFDLATVLAIPKSQIYDISHSGYCHNTTPVQYAQPESISGVGATSLGAPGYRGVSWISVGGQFYTGTGTDPGTVNYFPSGMANYLIFLQTTYHMILFNDQALDAFSTNNIAPVELLLVILGPFIIH